MDDSRTVTTNGVVAACGWLLTAGLLLVALVVMLSGHWKASILIAETACCASAWAAVRHLRCYAAEICHKIAQAHELDADIRRLTGVPGQRAQ